MKAILYHRYGGPEVLQLEDVPKPAPNDDQVLVKIKAVSVNDWDWGNIQGKPKFFRLFGGLTPRKKIQGSDIAGVVEAVGKNITKFKPGDEVFGDLSGQWGGFAEYVCCPEKMLALKSPKMSFEEAAAIPQAAMLAVQALIDKGHVKNGQKILINGAGGGVGTFGVQIAKQYDVEVTGVDSGIKLDIMRSVGFDHVIDYTKEDFTKNGKRYDLIVDTKTNRSVLSYLRSLTPNGIYATVGGDIPRLFQFMFLYPFIKLFSRKKVIVVILKTNKDLEYMKQLHDTGKLKYIIDGPYRLEETKRAFEIYAKQEHKGKMIIVLNNL